MTDRRFLFVVNPRAGRKSPEWIIPRIQQTFDVRDGRHELQVAEDRGKALRLAREASGTGFTHVVAVGGDGTVDAVVTGLLNTDAGLGVIPAGSGNDFTKSLPLPDRIEDALGVLRNGTNHCIDMGRFDDRYFVNGMGIGLDGAIAHRFDELRDRSGNMGYLPAALRELVTFRGKNASVTVQGVRYRGPVLFVSISNGRVQGQWFQNAPDGSLSDGLLDVQLVRNVSVLRRMMQVPRWLWGTQNTLREVALRQGTGGYVQFFEQVPAHVDGEPFLLAEGCHRFDVIKDAVEVICSS